MSKKKTPRTDTIMVIFRKAFNEYEHAKALKYLEEAHDAVEKLELDLIAAKEGR